MNRVLEEIYEKVTKDRDLADICTDCAYEVLMAIVSNYNIGASHYIVDEDSEDIKELVKEANDYNFITGRLLKECILAIEEPAFEFMGTIDILDIITDPQKAIQECVDYSANRINEWVRVVLLEGITDMAQGDYEEYHSMLRDSYIDYVKVMIRTVCYGYLFAIEGYCEALITEFKEDTTGDARLYYLVSSMRLALEPILQLFMDSAIGIVRVNLDTINKMMEG